MPAQPPLRILKPGAIRPATPNRESVTTINRDGSRLFLHPAETRGPWTTWRRIVAALLIVIYFALPWIPINGYPAVFLDVFARRFHLFGTTFAAQDIWMLFFLITGMAFSLFFATALWGRLWCGWACPQTVFMEHVFRRLERLIDGDPAARRRLEAAPWSGAKAARRLLKHGLFLLLSTLIAHFLLAYFVSLPRLYLWMGDSPVEHWLAFAGVAVLTVILYVDFAWFREQLCVIICPYGRLQSALIDDHTINVAYDEKRGEPRGKPGETTGHCIDCHRCVQVCPTGIDIRQGLQLECVACTACMDACDEIMDRLHRPRGLIRYDSETGLAGGRRRFWRPRVILYLVLLAAGLTAMIVAAQRSASYLASVTRMGGLPFYVTTTAVRNQYQLRLVNKSNQPASFTITLLESQPGLTASGLDRPVVLPPLGEEVVTFILAQDRQSYRGPFQTGLEIRPAEAAEPIRCRFEFLGPEAGLLNQPVPPAGF